MLILLLGRFGSHNQESASACRSVRRKFHAFQLTKFAIKALITLPLNVVLILGCRSY